MKLAVFVGAASVLLSGCAVTPETAFPGAATAQQCYQEFAAQEQRDRQAEQNARYTSGGNAIGTGFGVAIGRGMNESRRNAMYALCLDRVGATRTEIEQIEAGIGRGRVPKLNPKTTDGQRQTDKSLVEMCVEQTGAPGAYDWVSEGDVPVVRGLSDLGGTRQGANMINACIRQNAPLFALNEAAQKVPASQPPAVPAAARVPAGVSSSSPASCPPGVTGLYRGNLVC